MLRRNYVRSVAPSCGEAYVLGLGEWSSKGPETRFLSSSALSLSPPPLPPPEPCRVAVRRGDINRHANACLDGVGEEHTSALAQCRFLSRSIPFSPLTRLHCPASQSQLKPAQSESRGCRRPPVRGPLALSVAWTLVSSPLRLSVAVRPSPPRCCFPKHLVARRWPVGGGFLSTRRSSRETGPSHAGFALARHWAISRDSLGPSAVTSSP